MAGAVKVVKTKAPKAPKIEGDVPKCTRRPRASVPFAETQINAERAFEAAVRCGARDSISDYQRAYEATSRRRRAKMNDPEYLRRRLAELEGTAVPPNGAPVAEVAFEIA